MLANTWSYDRHRLYLCPIQNPFGLGSACLKHPPMLGVGFACSNIHMFSIGYACVKHPPVQRPCGRRCVNKFSTCLHVSRYDTYCICWTKSKQEGDSCFFTWNSINHASWKLAVAPTQAKPPPNNDLGMMLNSSLDTALASQVENLHTHRRPYAERMIIMTQG